MTLEESFLPAWMRMIFHYPIGSKPKLIFPRGTGS